MQLQILSTGSQGNCTIIQNKIVMDVGITKKAFLTYQIDESQLEAVVVTHRHKDHCQMPLVRYFITQEIPTYLPPDVIGMLLDENKIDINNYLARGIVHPIKAEQSITLPSHLIMTPYPQRHSNIINFAFVVENNTERLLYSTDLDTLESTDVGKGLVTLGQFDTILLEGNYDETYLRDYIQQMISLVNTETNPETLTDEELDKWVKKHYRQLPKEVSRNAFRAIQNRRHLSKQQARAFVTTHLKPGGRYYEMHRSSQFYERPDNWYDMFIE